jgi:hypothetical protein
MLQYSNHRLQQTLLVIKATQEETEKYSNSLDSIQKEINVVMEKIQENNTRTIDREKSKEL